MNQEPVIDKNKTGEELLNESVEFLDAMQFNMACFVDHFKRYVEKVK